MVGHIKKINNNNSSIDIKMHAYNVASWKVTL